MHIPKINCMKISQIAYTILFMAIVSSCNNKSTVSTETTSTGGEVATKGGQENVQDDVSAKDVVKVAISSKDHTTLVAALKQADLVTSLSNAGPFTVFAPTNAAFDKLPEGTVDKLMKDESKEDLQNILQYHVTVSAMKAESFTDGQKLGMVNGDYVTVNIVDGKVVLNNKAKIVASIPASNGIIHVIDEVLTPVK